MVFHCLFFIQLHNRYFLVICISWIIQHLHWCFTKCIFTILFCIYHPSSIIYIRWWLPCFTTTCRNLFQTYCAMIIFYIEGSINHRWYSLWKVSNDFLRIKSWLLNVRRTQHFYICCLLIYVYDSCLWLAIFVRILSHSSITNIIISSFITKE